MTAYFIFVYFLTLVPLKNCWQYFLPVTGAQGVDWSKLILTQNEYMFQDCKYNKIELQAHVHVDNKMLLGRNILRGWLSVHTLPTCIRLIATDDKVEDFQFQMSVVRVVFCHSQQRRLYYYFEWYLPIQVPQGIDWDLYFYGPVSEDWT